MKTWSVIIHEVGYIPDLPQAIYSNEAPAGALLDVPCYCFIATNGTTSVLVDSGADPELASRGNCTVVGGGRRSLIAGLAMAGLAPTDIRYILHTHLHYDHMSNDLLFPNAEVVVQTSELQWAGSAQAGPFYIGVEDLVAALGDRLVAIEGEREVLAGLRLLPNGGHTPGHQSVLVDVGDEQVCVCGDIVPMAANLTVVGPSTPDAAATQAFLHRARQAAWTMLPSHEPALRSHPWNSSRISRIQCQEAGE